MSAADAGLYAGAAVIVMGAFFSGVVLIINAIKGQGEAVAQKLDQAATRREQIGTAIIDPKETVLPPKEQP